MNVKGERCKKSEEGSTNEGIERELHSFRQVRIALKTRKKESGSVLEP